MAITTKAQAVEERVANLQILMWAERNLDGACEYRKQAIEAGEPDVLLRAANLKVAYEVMSEKTRERLCKIDELLECAGDVPLHEALDAASQAELGSLSVQRLALTAWYDESVAKPMKAIQSGLAAA